MAHAALAGGEITEGAVRGCAVALLRCQPVAGPWRALLAPSSPGRVRPSRAKTANGRHWALWLKSTVFPGWF